MTALALLGVAGLQLWDHGMQTLASVLIGTVLTLLVGLALGVWSARSDRVGRVLRPILDAAQTMPSFVYLIPAIALFSATRFTGIVAAIIYAAPPVIRIFLSARKPIVSSRFRPARGRPAGPGRRCPGAGDRH